MNIVDTQAETYTVFIYADAYAINNNRPATTVIPEIGPWLATAIAVRHPYVRIARDYVRTTTFHYALGHLAGQSSTRTSIVTLDIIESQPGRETRIGQDETNTEVTLTHDEQVMYLALAYPTLAEWTRSARHFQSMV